MIFQNKLNLAYTRELKSIDKNINYSKIPKIYIKIK